MKRAWAPAVLLVALGVASCQQSGEHPVSEAEYQELRTVVTENRAHLRDLNDWLVTVKDALNDLLPDPADVTDPPTKPPPWP